MVHSTGRRRLRRRGVMTATVLAALTPLVAACGGTDSGSGATSGASGAGFYSGKTITFIVANSVGSTQDALVRAVMPTVEAKLHATVKIVYVAGATTIGDNKIAASPADGLTIGYMNLNTVLYNIISNVSPINFDLNKVSYVGASPQPTDLVVACSGSPFQTWHAVRTSTKPVTVVDVPTGPSNALQRVLLGSFGTPSKFVTGYTTDTLGEGCQRGDGDIAASTVSNFLDTSEKQMVKGETPLLLTGKVPDGSAATWLNDKVPTLSDYAKQYPPTTAAGKSGIDLALLQFAGVGNVIYGPPGIPKDRLAALTDAFQAGLATAKGKQGFLDQGVPPTFLGPSDILKTASTSLQHKALLAGFLK
jgi:tripartite-type tricarboxylate transporter receptor subunit TctC